MLVIEVDIDKTHNTILRYKKNDLIVADSAEPLTINEIRKAGFNVQKSIKGKDSVKNGISKLKDYEIIVDKESSNIIKELNNYCWNDKKSETPIDDYNHTIDPLRYCMQILDRKKGFFVI